MLELSIIFLIYNSDLPRLSPLFQMDEKLIRDQPSLAKTCMSSLCTLGSPQHSGEDTDDDDSTEMQKAGGTKSDQESAQAQKIRLAKLAAIDHRAEHGLTLGIMFPDMFVAKGNRLLIMTDPGADVDDETMLLTVFKDSTISSSFDSIHICIVDGVEAKPGTPTDATVRWENFKEMFSDIDVPTNVFFHTSSSICSDLASVGITHFADMVWAAPIWQDTSLLELWQSCTVDRCTSQGNEESFNMGGSVKTPEDKAKYDVMQKAALSAIGEIYMLPTPICREVQFTPKMVEKIQTNAPDIARLIEEGAAVMFFGRMPPFLARAASVLEVNLGAALGYAKKELVEEHLGSSEHAEFIAANQPATDQYLKILGENSGAGKMDACTSAVNQIMNVVSYISDGSLRYAENSLSKFADGTFKPAFASWQAKKGEARMTPAYDVLTLMVHMHPEYRSLVEAGDSEALIKALEEFM